jgi:hypothetical protein
MNKQPTHTHTKLKSYLYQVNKKNKKNKTQIFETIDNEREKRSEILPETYNNNKKKKDIF